MRYILPMWVRIRRNRRSVYLYKTKHLARV